MVKYLPRKDNWRPIEYCEKCGEEAMCFSNFQIYCPGCGEKIDGLERDEFIPKEYRPETCEHSMHFTDRDAFCEYCGIRSQVGEKHVWKYLAKK